MKKIMVCMVWMLMGLLLAGMSACAAADIPVAIMLSDGKITVDGKEAGTNDDANVYVANDIVFYLAGQGFTYGEGTEADEHEQSEADEHTVVHITKPGTYELSGSLSKGQIAIDLGKKARKDPKAVVTLILNGVDINCDVAPAIIFYNVYEPFEDVDEDDAVNNVDTSAAGANVIIADGSTNNVEGSYVARIYKSIELSDDGKRVVDSKKLHKYDAAFYSMQTMNVSGGEVGDGVLNIVAENEGLDSEMHLTVNGGNIHIVSGNDGINTNEDGVSVFTMNGGILNIRVEGRTGEGDGIDSNGWLIINGGKLTSAACGQSMDAGIDSDMGIHINGGSVSATGNMLDRISESAQTYVVFRFADVQKGGSSYVLKDTDGKVVGEWTPANDFSTLVVSDMGIVPGTYTLWMGDVQLAGAKSGMHGMIPMGGMQPPAGADFPQGGRLEMPDGMEFPLNGGRPEKPESRGFSQDGKGPGFGGNADAEVTTAFEIVEGENTFAYVKPAE